MSNPWTQFQRLIAPGAKTIVTVTTVNTDGTSIVTLRSGDTVRVQGDTVTAGSKAIIQNGRILRTAPDLTHYDVDI